MQHIFFAIHFLCFFLSGLLITTLLYRLAVPVFRFANIAETTIAIVILSALLIVLLVYLFLAIKKYYALSPAIAAVQTPLIFTGFILSLGIFYSQFLFFYTLMALRH